MLGFLHALLNPRRPAPPPDPEKNTNSRMTSHDFRHWLESRSPPPGSTTRIDSGEPEMPNSFKRSFTITTALLLAGCGVGILLQAYKIPYQIVSAVRGPSERNWAHFEFERTEVDPESISRERLMVALVLGQSNAANHGETRHRSGPGVYNFYRGKVYHALDPMLGATGKKGSVWTRLGDRLIQNGGYQSVVFAPVAMTSTRIREWTPDGKLYPRMIKTIQELQAAGLEITHLLWHQGETDALWRTSGSDYRSRFALVLESIRREGVDAPIYVSVATWNSFTRSTLKIADAQRALVDGREVLSGPNTDALDYCDRYDGTHFSTEGLDHVASLWMESLSRQQGASESRDHRARGSQAAR